MKILALTSNMPYPGHVFAGAFNEKCVATLRELSQSVTVLTPRPYVPPLASFVPRWRAYSTIRRFEVRQGVPVHRPATLVVPGIASALWVDRVAFLGCRSLARKLNGQNLFDVLMSFDLVQTGGIAWRIARDLGIPASGWAFGSDVRFPKSSPFGRVVRRALEELDIVFYQSRELLEKAAELLGVSPCSLPPDRHVVLPHGIPPPPHLPWREIRCRVRKEWDIPEQQLVIVNTGRIFREKGVFELLDAFSLAASRNPQITCIILGCNPAFDETDAVKAKLDRMPSIRERVRLLPACSPEKVWEYLCAADIYAFPSHKEGIPNSLLEAMAMGLPCIAFAIPPVLEIEAGSGALITVPPLDPKPFSEAMLRLAANPDQRLRMGEIAKAQIMDRFMVRKNMAKALAHLDHLVEKRSLSGSGYTNGQAVLKSHSLSHPLP